MSEKTSNIPQWAEKQLRSGLKLENKDNIRTALDTLSLEHVTDFFKVEKDITKNTAKSAYAIAMYQKALEFLSFKPIEVDGLYKMKNPKIESETKKMIKKFQTMHKITVDGIPGSKTAEKIYEALQNLQKPNIQKAETRKVDITPAPKIEKELPPTNDIEGAYYFKFADVAPFTPITPIPEPIVIPPKETSFWEDVVSSLKSRFVSKK